MALLSGDFWNVSCLTGSGIRLDWRGCQNWSFLADVAAMGGKRTVWLGIWNRILYFIDPVALD